MSIQAFPYILLLGVLFGSTLVASRFSVEQFHPLTYIGLRLTVASLGYAAIFTFSSKRGWPKDLRLWRLAAILGVIGTAVPMTFIVSSLQYQSSGITAVLITTSPVITVLMAHFLLPDEPLTKQKGLGVVVALAGAFLLVVLGESGLPEVSKASPTGYILVFAAMFFGSGAAIFMRKYLCDYPAVEVTGIRMFSAALVVMIVSLPAAGFDLSSVDSSGLIAFLYAALVGTFLGLMLAFYNVKRFGATAAAMTAYIIPVVATIGGVLLLGEKITIGMVGGIILIITGVILINRSPALNQSGVDSLPG